VSEGWWTRSQSIRIAGETQFVVKLLDAEDGPVYQRIASKALQLKQLGLSTARVAQALDVSDKTVAKAIKWVEVSHSSEQEGDARPLNGSRGRPSSCG
jgi:hypothetical protein